MLNQLTGHRPVLHATCDANLGQVPPQRPKPRGTWLIDFPALSDRMASLLAKGDTTGDYGVASWGDKRRRSATSHAITAAAAAGCARFGWTRSQFLEAMLQRPSPCGDHARQMGHEQGVRYLDRVWKRALTFIDRQVISCRGDAVADLMALRDAIASCTWRGIAGSTALRVLMAHWHAAKRAGGRVYTLSYREAAEIAGCTARTAYLAVKFRLRRWLRLVERGEGETASTWRLIDGFRAVPGYVAQASNPSFGGAPSGGAIDPAVIERLMGLDAFAHRGLGSSSLKILAALHLQSRQAPKDLTETAMVSLATVYRHLARLAEHGLATKEGDGTLWRLTPLASRAMSDAREGWDEIASDIGTYGTLWRRQQLHRDERAIWQGYVYPRIQERRMPDVTPVRGDEVDDSWVVDGRRVVDPQTGEIIPNLVVASDHRLLFLDHDPDYEELVGSPVPVPGCSTG